MRCQPWVFAVLASLLAACAARHAMEPSPAPAPQAPPSTADLARDVALQVVDWAQDQPAVDLPHDQRVFGGTDLVLWIGVQADPDDDDPCLTPLADQLADKLGGGDADVAAWITRGGAPVRFAVVDSGEAEKALEKVADDPRIKDSRLSRAPTLLYLWVGTAADGSPTVHLWGLTADREAQDRSTESGRTPGASKEWFLPRGDGVVAPLRAFVLPDIPLSSTCNVASAPVRAPIVARRCAANATDADGIASMEARILAAWNVLGGRVYGEDGRDAEGNLRTVLLQRMDGVLFPGDVTCEQREPARPEPELGYCASWACDWNARSGS